MSTLKLAIGLALGALVGCDDSSNPEMPSAHGSGCLETGREAVTFDDEREGFSAGVLLDAMGDRSTSLVWTDSNEETELRVTVGASSQPEWVTFASGDPELHIACPSRFEASAPVMLATADRLMNESVDARVFAVEGVSVEATLDLKNLIAAGIVDESANERSARFLTAIIDDDLRGSMSLITVFAAEGGIGSGETAFARWPDSN